MSLVWHIIAIFLYVEIGIVLLLTLPIFSAPKWQKLFKSRFLAALTRQAQIYFYLLLGVLVIFLLEAIREMRKYSGVDPNAETSLNLGMQHSMRLFRAQRNFYISGFAIFLTLVIRRLVILISQQASLLANAESATTTKKSAEKGDATDANLADKKKIIDLELKVKEITQSLVREQKDKEAMKSQAESLNKEYDRLTEEYSKLQNKTKTTSGGGKSD